MRSQEDHQRDIKANVCGFYFFFFLFNSFFIIVYIFYEVAFDYLADLLFKMFVVI